MKLQDVLLKLPSLSGTGKNFKPHKYLVLLSITELIKENEILNNTVNFDDKFKRVYTKYFNQYSGKNDRNRPHTPFFHLRTSGFWKLVPNKITETEIDSISSVGGPTELNKLISHAEIELEFFNEIKTPEKRVKFENKIKSILNSENRSENHELKETSSLYSHEAMAIKEIKKLIQPRNLGFLCSNIEIHDPQTNRYFEIDVLIVSRFGIYVVELKHWTGNIEVRPYNWFVNGMPRSDPHKTNNFKAKLIKGLCEHKYPFFKIPFVTSVVVLTHPQVFVENASSPKAMKGQPTLDSITDFIDYLKFQEKTQQAALSNEEAKTVRDYIRSLHQPGKPRVIQFPGHEIVKRLYQAEDREELIALPTDVRARRLTRLRIFFNTASFQSDISRESFERAKATLEAVSNIGYHLNILQVWSVPSQEGHLIEGSDWSEQGTLRDMMSKSAPLTEKTALTIVTGILSGLDAIHKKGVVHRNLRPENILMVEGIPKLMNFDLSYQMVDDRLTVIPDPFQLTRDAYIAPEIYQGQPFDDNADLFSLGVIFYEMLTGKKPFKCSLDLEIKGGELAVDCMAKLAGLNLSEAVMAAIVSLIQADRKNRPATAEIVFEKLTGRIGESPEIPNKQLKPGDIYDSYQILDFIKQGTESQIYKARWIDDEIFCLKLFNIDVPQDRINREKKYSASVTHSSIVKAENCLRWDGTRWFIAFKWVEGKPLLSEGAKNLPDIATFGGVAQSLLKALEALHGFEADGEAIPILHNDIKPDNILITEGDSPRPKLIDFGIASNPGTFLYAGSSGYVPPDSFSGEDRNYTVQGDLFGLGVALFEWFFGTKPYAKLSIHARPIEITSIRNELPPTLADWFYQAVAPFSENRFQNATVMREALERALLSENEKQTTVIEPDPSEPAEIEHIKAEENKETEVLSFDLPSDASKNYFISYLNTLQNLDASSGNALAENQACKEWFYRIQVKHPLTERIYYELTSNKKHVILTGHAGDGKTTIGLELYRKIFGCLPDAPLSKALGKREDLKVKGSQISIIKDFSEWDDDKRLDVIKEAESKNSIPILLISNTGTLLDAFHRLAKQRDKHSWLSLESTWLESFSSPFPKIVKHNNTEFLVINLAMFDNLALARKIFEKMIDAQQWESCDRCREYGVCCIRRNVALLQSNPVAVDRMFQIYRRLFEYGERFTVRQLIAHMAYLITAGMEYEDIVEHANRPIPPPLAELLFFNRFFGDNGRVPDADACQLKIVRVLRNSEIGEKTCPMWERRLWLRNNKSDIHLNAKDMNEDFEGLRRIGAGMKTKGTHYQGPLGQKHARRQVRRMLYFLYDAKEVNGNHAFQIDTYLSSFLLSAMLLDLSKWRKRPDQFNKKAEIELRQKILHVLQEHFTGIRLPEKASFDTSLYITLNRNVRDVRQSAQIVLADFRVKDFQIQWIQNQEEFFMAPMLEFKGIGPLRTAQLKLELPFLDYVMMRHKGEIGQALQTSFVDRLERFKAQLIKLARTDSDNHKVMLLRLQTNHTFQEHQIFMDDDKLEVMRNA